MGYRGALHATSFIRACAAAGALLLAATGASAQTPPPTTELDVPAAGTLKIVDGDVRVIGTDYEERRVKPGDRIASTERLITGRESAASLVLRDGTVMALGPRTNVDLSRFSYNATTQEGSVAVRLVRGSMRMITGLIGRANPGSVSVSTRTATVGVRGTDFIVSVDEANP